jgi:hypothetical protein
MEQADAAVREVLERELLTSEVIEYALARLVARAQEPVESVEVKRTRILDAMRVVDRKLARLKEAIADPDGGDLRTIREAIKEVEADRDRLQQQIGDLDALPAIRDAAEHIRVDALRSLDEWRGLLGGHVGHARQLLRRLLDGRLIFEPKRDGDDRWYEFLGAGTLDKFFAGVNGLKTAKIAVASPTGIEYFSRLRGAAVRVA